MACKQKLRKISMILFFILYALCWANIICEAFVVSSPDSVRRALSVSIAVSYTTYPCIVAFILIILLNIHAKIRFSLRTKEWRELLYIVIAWIFPPIFEHFFVCLTL